MGLDCFFKGKVFVKNKFLTVGLLSSVILLQGNLFAAPVLWVDRADSSESTALSEINNFNQNSLLAKPSTKPFNARKVALNTSVLDDILGASSSFLAKPSSASEEAILSIPLPDGGIVELKAEAVSVMSPELAKQFPQIQTWRVTGENDVAIHGRIDRTEHGFHAMVVMPDGDTIFIEPDKSNSDIVTSNKYLSFGRKSNVDHFKTNFQCKFHPDGHTQNLFQSPVVKANNTLSKTLAKPALSMKVYRLAVAATGEYTQFHGGTKSAALSAIVTTINRVNEVYERDLSVSFNLIANETDIIYTNKFSDPYTNDDIDALIEENVLNLNFGDLNSASYDIGHVFGAGEVGGLAQFGSACDNDLKAAGATGIDGPIGDVFSIGYVAHELGHQLGATHTFNSSCRGGQRTQIRAVEPGSGSTIMSYAGVCGGGNDLQDNPDPQFHAISILDILEYTRNEGGSNCGARVGVSNQQPEVDAGSDVTIPTRTPFMLVADGSDSDGDTLTYTWEQTDTGTETPIDSDAGDNAIFRSRAASQSKTRYIPRIRDLFSGNFVKGERIPVEDRDVNFAATVRDGKGGIEFDGLKMTLVSTGRPFRVTSHRSSETLSFDESTTVTWDVAGTNSTPISCSQVNIRLIEEDGDQFHLIKTANDGEQKVTLPKNAPNMSKARIMVACSNNSFFNISTGNLKVNSESSSSGGGSTGYWMGLLMLFGLLRRIKGIKK